MSRNYYNQEDIDKQYPMDDVFRDRFSSFNGNYSYGNAFENNYGGYAYGEMLHPQIWPMGPRRHIVPEDIAVPTDPVVPEGCGTSEGSIKNLPKELLKMYKPKHCGLCSEHFDSLFIARLHYISKTHMNNQRSWLIKYNKTLQLNQQPFKSRSKYCELCDVHITSKILGDLHYAGRLHRAIVARRKEPKNNALKLPCMKLRLATLIRREKKFLKPRDEEARDAALALLKEEKKVPPELYCDICKTAVTCSEQMTMHLNGKRHLGKEMRKIWQYMRNGEGDTSRANLRRADGTNNNEKAQCDAECAKDKATKVKDTAKNNNTKQEKLD